MGEPKLNFRFRSGKYQGQTYEWVCDKNPSYIRWVKENQPNMLVERITKKIDVKNEVKPFGKLEFNANFDNEGPDPNSIPYLEKMKRESKDDEYNF